MSAETSRTVRLSWSTTKTACSLKAGHVLFSCVPYSFLSSQVRKVFEAWPIYRVVHKVRTLSVLFTPNHVFLNGSRDCLKSRTKFQCSVCPPRAISVSFSFPLEMHIVCSACRCTIAIAILSVCLSVTLVINAYTLWCIEIFCAPHYSALFLVFLVQILHSAVQGFA